MSHFQAINVVQYNINTEELYVILKEFIHLLYFRWDSATSVIHCNFKKVTKVTKVCSSYKMERSSHITLKVCLPLCLNQAPAGEPSRQKSGHHRVHPLPVSLQGDAHQSFLQTVWGVKTKHIRVLYTLLDMFGKSFNGEDACHWCEKFT